MPRENVPFFAFNRGLIDPEALARVDQDRTKLSAETMDNWLPKTQGAMRIRPGLKYLGSTLNDTGALFVEFVNSTTDNSLLEFTEKRMRVWTNDELVARPYVSTTLSLTDTGWYNLSVGGGQSAGASIGSDVLPKFVDTGPVSGVSITASAYDPYNTNGDNQAYQPWRVADNATGTRWEKTGSRPQWLKVNFGSGVTKRIKQITIRAANASEFADNCPTSFTLQGNDVDTGNGWTTEITVSGQSSWGVGEKRTFTDTGYTDTGANAWRYWRLYMTAADDPGNTAVAELEMFQGPEVANDTGQAIFTGSGNLILNAGARGAIAKVEKRIVLTDTGMYNVEHSIQVDVERGPVTFRVGRTSLGDDYIKETSLATGWHNLAFTPVSANIYVSISSDSELDRILTNVSIGDTGTLEVTTPWANANLTDIRFDQSANVMYIDCDGVAPYKVERRASGRSWSVVQNVSDDGPFRSGKSSSAKLSLTGRRGNVSLLSDVPFFDAGHAGALFRLEHEGQSGLYYLGRKDSATDPLVVTGILDTGTDTNNERRITFSVSGLYVGTVEIQRSYDGATYGFQPALTNFMGGSTASDTGTFSRTVEDEDDNLIVFYRAVMKNYTSGTAKVTVTYKGGLTEGICRATAYVTNQKMDVEILQQFSDTQGTEYWDEGAWSTFRGYPSAVAFHEGRLVHAGVASVWASVPDSWQSFDDTIDGSAAPLNKAIGSGPIEAPNFLASTQALILSTAGSESALRASNLDEPVTAANSALREFSTLGSAPIRAIKHDTEMFMVQRSQQRVYRIGIGFETADYEPIEMSVLVPTLMSAGVVSWAVQRMPDGRLHCVLADGTVALLTYEEKEEVLAWSRVVTDGAIEGVVVLPGVKEDQVYYVVNRTITDTGTTPNTKRFLEKWALETESLGDTGLSWLSDASVSYTDTGRTHVISGLSHLIGEQVIVWADDTGQTDAGRDLSYDTGSPRVQKTYTVSAAGTITLDTGSGGVHHAVVGLAYSADWLSSKLAYAAEAGSPLTMMKRTDKIGFVLRQTHNNALFFGSDTGNLDPMQRVMENGDVVDRDRVFKTFDKTSMPFPGLWDEDSRIYLKAKAPRPATVLALVPTVGTEDKV